MAIIWDQKVEIGWNNHQQKYFLSLGYPKLKQGERFTVPVRLLTEGNSTEVDMVCDNCEKVFKGRFNKLKYNNQFCSLKCSGQFKSRHKWENKQCEFCSEEFTALKTLKQRFCSMGCQSKWQSTYLVGENAVGYKHEVIDRIRSCSWCGSDFKLRPYRLKEIEKREDKRAFCSTECRRTWYANDWSQREEWKTSRSEAAVQLLTSGVFEKTNTSPQNKVNLILDELDVKYENEYDCKYFSIDNYLLDYNLMIEIMGTYWHTDHRKYEKISYQNQIDRCVMDKRKKSYVQNNYNTKILYLWEEDIENYPTLIKELIIGFIESKGFLKDYHSFNYCIDKSLTLKTFVEKPYFELDPESRIKYIDLSSGVKTKKQDSKWITFNCETCGCEKEQLKSKYGKSKNHFCSQECKKNVGRAKHNCTHCGEEMWVEKYRFNEFKKGKLKSLCCSKECSHLQRWGKKYPVKN